MGWFGGTPTFGNIQLDIYKRFLENPSKIMSVMSSKKWHREPNQLLQLDRLGKTSHRRPYCLESRYHHPPAIPAIIEKSDSTRWCSKMWSSPIILSRFKGVSRKQNHQKTKKTQKTWNIELYKFTAWHSEWHICSLALHSHPRTRPVSNVPQALVCEKAEERDWLNPIQKTISTRIWVFP